MVDGSIGSPTGLDLAHFYLALEGNLEGVEAKVEAYSNKN